jgi:hypothetical protein
MVKFGKPNTTTWTRLAFHYAPSPPAPSAVRVPQSHSLLRAHPAPDIPREMTLIYLCRRTPLEHNLSPFAVLPENWFSIVRLIALIPSLSYLAHIAPHSLPPSVRRSGRTIFGILGMISLSLCRPTHIARVSSNPLNIAEYVIVMTGREFKGRLMGHDIYRATDFDLLPLSPNINVFNPPHPVEAHLLALVRSHLMGGVFLFSYSWDLTRRLQTQWESREKDTDRPFWETVSSLCWG